MILATNQNPETGMCTDLIRERQVVEEEEEKEEEEEEEKEEEEEEEVKEVKEGGGEGGEAEKGLITERGSSGHQAQEREIGETKALVHIMVDLRAT